MQRARLRRTRSLLACVLGAGVVGFPTVVAAGDWTITPRISGQESFTDNVFFTPTDKRADFITSLSPGINISGESTRVLAKLDYSPTLNLYAFNPSQNFVGHNLYGNGTATIVPDLFFFDARAYASLQPTTPALSTGLQSFAPATLGPSFTNVSLSQGIPKLQLSQVSSFSASPYIVQRFDGFGTGELRYTLNDTNFSGVQGTTSITPASFALQNTSSLTNELTAVFVTGENFGAFSSRLLLDAAQSSGTGVLNNANQAIAIVDSAYALTYRIAALGTIGHENIHFGGFPPTSIDDLVWGIGTRLNPSPDLNLVLSYGHRNGTTAPYASLVYNVTARTTVSAEYSEGLATVSQEIANNLAISDLNQLGQTVDARTLLPFAITNPVLGLQSGLFRMKQLTGTVRTDLERDHLTLSAFRSENLLVAQSTPGVGTSQTSLGINVIWSRELNPLTTSSLGFGYASFTSPAPSNTDETLFTAVASLNYALNSSTTAWAAYNFADRTSPQPQLRFVVNGVLVGIRKEF